MTHPEQIMQAVATLTQRGKQTFARVDVRDTLGLNHNDWMAGYTAVFQGMREDQPGGAPDVSDRFKNVFRRVRWSVFELTTYGHGLLQQFMRRPIDEF